MFGSVIRVANGLFTGLAAALALILGLMSAPASAASRSDVQPFFGEDLPEVGQEFWDLPLGTKVTAKHLSVTLVDEGEISGTAALRTGHGVLHTDFTWSGDCDWSFTVRPHVEHNEDTWVPAGNITGNITRAECHNHIHLMLEDYTLGDQELDIALHAVPHSGFEGYVETRDLRIGDLYFPVAKVTVSTLQKAARVEGTMETDLGTFQIDASVSGPEEDYRVRMHVSGADMKVEGQGFHFREFTFDAEFHRNAHDHYTAHADLTGTVSMHHKTYELQHGHIKVSGGEVKQLAFQLHLTHQTSPTETYSGNILLSLDRDGGQLTEMFSGTNSNGYTIVTEEVTYHKALVGQLTVGKSRTFSKKFRGKRFRRSVSIGLTFGIGVYTRDGSNWDAYVGAGGGFSANRVSGAFGCYYETHANDFTCPGTLRINPRWAGVYRFTWVV